MVTPSLVATAMVNVLEGASLLIASVLVSSVATDGRLVGSIALVLALSVPLIIVVTALLVDAVMTSVLEGASLLVASLLASSVATVGWSDGLIAIVLALSLLLGMVVIATMVEFVDDAVDDDADIVAVVIASTIVVACVLVPNFGMCVVDRLMNDVLIFRAVVSTSHGGRTL